MGGHGNRARRAASGVALGLLLLVPTAAGGWVARTGPRRLKHCWTYMKRIERGEATRHNVTQLAREGRGLGFVERFLEGQARAGEYRESAVENLYRYFPGSESARTVGEFEAIANASYFRRTEEHVVGPDLTPAERIARWREFVREHSEFPGRAKAAYLLARCEEESGDPVSAFLTLTEALEWPEGEHAGRILSRLTNVIDAQLTRDEALAVAARAQDARFRRLVSYTAAVKLAQDWCFSEAVARLDAFMLEVEGGADVALVAESPRYFVWRGADGKPQVRTGAFLADLAEQRALWARLAAIQASGGGQAEGRPRALRRLADAVLATPHAFENLVIHDHVVTNAHGERPWAHGAPDARFDRSATARNHLAQAAALYEAAAAEGLPGPERSRALAGAAVARTLILGFWGAREGHAVPQDWDARADAAARAIALALASGASDGTRPAVEARVLAAWQAMVGDVKHAMREGRDHCPWPDRGSEHAVARELRKRAAVFWRDSIEKPALALGQKQGG